MKIKARTLKKKKREADEYNGIHIKNDYGNLGARNRKSVTVSVGVQTKSVNQTTELSNKHAPFSFEGNDDCVIVFDSTSSKSNDVQKTPELQGSSDNTSNETRNLLHCYTTNGDDECSIVFDSALEASSANRDLTREGSPSNAGNHEVKRNAHFMTVGQQEFDLQTRQILAAREAREINLDVEEVHLDFEPSPLHQLFYAVRSIPKATKEELISQGITIHLGKWSKQEDKILLRNYYNFVEKYEIDNPVLLLGLYGGGCKKSGVRKFIRAKKFYFCLGKDLDDRPISSIYSRARQLLDFWNYKGKFSKNEIQKIIALQKKFGNMWTTIAVHLNRATFSCRSVYRCFGKTFKGGQWSAQESAMLLKAVKRVVGKRKLLSTFRGYPWKEIAKYVPGRSDLQCRLHWLYALCWKPRVLDQPKWKKVDTALLIHSLHSDMVEEECFIDWDMLYGRFKSSVSSYVALQKHWYRLKCMVPNRTEKDHESIVMYLYKNYLPKILKRCNISESDLKHMN